MARNSYKRKSRAHRMDGKASVPGKTTSKDARELAEAAPPQALPAWSCPALKTGIQPVPRGEVFSCQEVCTAQTCASSG